jgi:hypothetical protein
MDKLRKCLELLIEYLFENRYTNTYAPNVTAQHPKEGPLQALRGAVLAMNDIDRFGYKILYDDADDSFGLYHATGNGLWTMVDSWPAGDSGYAVRKEHEEKEFLHGFQRLMFDPVVDQFDVEGSDNGIGFNVLYSWPSCDVKVHLYRQPELARIRYNYLSSNGWVDTGDRRTVFDVPDSLRSPAFDCEQTERKWSLEKAWARQMAYEERSVLWVPPPCYRGSGQSWCPFESGESKKGGRQG